MTRKTIFSIAKLVAIGAFITPVAIAANKPSQLVLLCKASRFDHAKDVEDSDKEVQMSLVLNESEHSAIINGKYFKNVEFGVSRVSGESISDHPFINGLSYKSFFLVDRVTGKFFFGNLPEPTSGGRFTEEQKQKIGAGPADPQFMGTCAPSKPLF